MLVKCQTSHLRRAQQSLRSQLPHRFVSHRTHEILNVSREFVNVNIYEADPSIRRSVAAFTNSDPSTVELLHNHGALCGSRALIETGVLAERNRPVLRQFDTFGRRIDVVDFHPSYHELMSLAKEVGTASYGYVHENASPDSHVVRGVLSYLQGQVDPGHGCPITMTNAAIPVLSRIPGCADLVRKLRHQSYDPRDVPMSEKQSITAGMSMTEKQGGSDVRANTTMATPADGGKTGQGAGYYLTGHKWFTSAPMCDVFLTLAKTKGNDSPSCFLVPRWCPDGSRNSGFKVMRLKDKLADRSNASSEVEYDNAWGEMIGEEGRGVRTIIEMVQATRLDCAIGSASTAKRAVMEALNYTSHRSAFGARLTEQPLMQNLLADLCVESEAHTLLAMRMARLFNDATNHERAGDPQHESGHVFRVGIAVSKYYITKRLPNLVYECMEAHGGNGFVEDLPMARMYRHAPLNSIWEGSGNVMTLDVLRAAQHLPLLMKEIKECVPLGNAALNAYIQALEKDLFRLLKGATTPESMLELQRHARNLVDRLAVALQASVLMRFGCPVMAEMYVESRVFNGRGDSRGMNFGSTVYSADNLKHVLQENIPTGLLLSV